jgi:aryl-alcohol dehydrogenase-like predicted oxidoreductase
VISTQFPDLNLRPSVLCLGVAEHGSAISNDESLAMLDAFAEAGGNFADSAHIYAAWLQGGAGQSERALGRWIQSRQPENFIVATKGGHPNLDTMEISRLTPADISRDLGESLERLQLDSISLYWLHRDDISVPVGEVMDALNRHIRAGQIQAIGASNWSTARIGAADDYTSQHGLIGFCASQIGWSLAEINESSRGAGNTLQMDDATLKWHRRSGFAACSYSSQANGFFAHALPKSDESATPKQKSLAHSYGSERNKIRHQKATQLARELDRTPNEIALAYLWSQSFPSVAIIGARNLAQLDSSLKSRDLKLSPEQVAWLEGA